MTGWNIDENELQYFNENGVNDSNVNKWKYFSFFWYVYRCSFRHIMVNVMVNGSNVYYVIFSNSLLIYNEYM